MKHRSKGIVLALGASLFAIGLSGSDVHAQAMDQSQTKDKAQDQTQDHDQDHDQVRAKDQIHDNDKVKDDVTESELLEQAYAARENDATYVRFRQNIHRDAELSDAELASTERLLWEYHHRGGDHRRMRRTARQAAASQCKGKCLAAILEFVPRAMHSGVKNQSAIAMTSSALREHLSARLKRRKAMTDAESAKGLRTRLQSRLTQWQRTRDQQALRSKERTRERLRDAETSRAEARESSRERARDRERERPGAGPR